MTKSISMDVEFYDKIQQKKESLFEMMNLESFSQNIQLHTHMFFVWCAHYSRDFVVKQFIF
jgi:hypothetical protein